MSTRFDIPAGEHGVIRVFAVDLPDEIRAAAHADYQATNTLPPPVSGGLGGAVLDPAFIEFFDITDLGDLGLANYLITGLGVGETELESEQVRLGALNGSILILLSGAFSETGQTVEVSSPLRWIATYSEETTPPRFEPLPDESARQSSLSTRPAPSDAAMSGRIAMLALLVIFLLTLAVVWVAS